MNQFPRVISRVNPARLGSLLIAATLSLALLAAGAAPEPTCYFILLNKGEGRAKLKDMSKEAVAKMQADHVGNLGTLGKQGRGLAAGPLGDNGFIRGIVVLKVASLEEVKDCFKPDPFVQNDVLAVEAHPWLANVNGFGKPDEPFAMAQHTLAIVRKGPNFQAKSGAVTPDELVQALPSLRTQSDTGELVVSGPMLDAKELFGVMLFRSASSTNLQTQLDQEPAVKSGRLTVEFHPQFMGSGVLGKATPPAKPGN